MVRGIFKNILRLWQSLEIFNVFNALNLKHFLQNKNLFQKAGTFSSWKYQDWKRKIPLQNLL